MYRLVAYVAGPYTAPTTSQILRNITAARAVAEELWRMGFVVLCPHLNSALMEGVIPDEDWYIADLALLKRCDLLVTAPSWQDSRGAREEVAVAQETRIPVYHWPEDRERLRRLTSELSG